MHLLTKQFHIIKILSKIHTIQYFWRVSRETLPQLTLFTSILFQLLSEHVLKQKFKPKYELFLLKNRKIRRALGAPPLDSLASGGGGHCPQRLRLQIPIGLWRVEAPPSDHRNSFLHDEFLAARMEISLHCRAILFSRDAVNSSVVQLTAKITAVVAYLSWKTLVIWLTIFV